MEEEKEQEANDHNYTECCKRSNVSVECRGFCSVRNILQGSTGREPEACELDFPAIVSCMADGRDHTPCCAREGVPDLCQDVCKGQYTPITDHLRTHVSCAAHTEPALACISRGVNLLPGQPRDVELEPLTERSIRVSWQPPASLARTVQEYIISHVALETYDPAERKPTSTGVQIQTRVPAAQNSTVLSDLTPYTMYEVTVTARNSHGSSLPSYGVRSLTLLGGLSSPASAEGNVSAPPDLPDVRKCCVEHGVNQPTCLDRMCDPKQADVVEVMDLMVCAPWAGVTFQCLANGVDHSPCCQARGIPNSCLPLCHGNITNLDFSYFKCLRYMSDYSSCLLQGYGVLAGPPSRLRAPHVASTFAVIRWNPPRVLGDTVLMYHVHYRELNGFDEFGIIEKDRSPLVLEGLRSGTDYEVFISAINSHGVGSPSPRLVFRTDSLIAEDSKEIGYNITACCVGHGVSQQCMGLCTYNAKMSELRALGNTCQTQIPSLVKCAAGGRDHTPCCSRRAVPQNCMSMCRGVIGSQPGVTASECLPYIGNIVQCFEEGTEYIPGPVSELHAVTTTNTSIALAWLPPWGENNTTPEKQSKVTYEVHYGLTDEVSLHETVLKLENQIATNDTSIGLTGLQPGSLYKVFVIAQNENGTSLPSSVLFINTSSDADPGSNAKQLVAGVPSPPHSLSVSERSATWLTVAWQPPQFTHPEDQIHYKIYYKAAMAQAFNMSETTLTAHELHSLQPNTQHVVYIVAISKRGSSLPSETLVAWTDPAFPAFVEIPTVHPVDLVSEGNSMTVLCIAMGVPTPTISLYVGGTLVRQDTARHMVTVIHNVTTDMDQVSCYADNGYGTPMQASRRINISFAPRISAGGITVAAPGDTVSLQCIVRGQPEPKVIFWRDHQGRIPVIQGPRYDINIKQDNDDKWKYIMTLTIAHVTASDAGDYYCHAENVLGAVTRPVSVRLRNSAAGHNVTECCREQNVSPACNDACGFYLDIEAVIDRPECLKDFDKLMKCAADGSDHRNCCASAGVPRGCLDWCRGEPIGAPGSFCSLHSTRKIIGCFQEGRDRLPGPPQNVAVRPLSEDAIEVHWDPPIKNPHAVEMYRVFWREESQRGSHRNDTPFTNMMVNGLKSHVLYELVVKAGNHYGTSMLSRPVQFTLDDNYITSASRADAGSTVGVGVGCALLALAAAGAVLWVALWYRGKRRGAGKNAPGGVAFENPSYLREGNPDHVQIPAVSSSETSNSQNWNNGTATLQVSTATELNPSLYEELKLGKDGVGFKRMVP
ncbi:Ig-like and fibronectin type-III domain-containing protein 2 [Ctenocephalides felis]|uniref:Ig-like and fibronectin type-III domain-containing protein 2 n=1 Tax=Ctenocephalides felis TaxID=7515 RepID=UPI000E6E128D|nr:Ig-like and fibronectin type-III domain-containing protein 2 [Ctenocephalides felis]